jgi:uncharacterized membrane protein YeiH
MILEVLNLSGLIAFSASGVLKGVKNKLDIFGVVVLAVVTSLGGGILRDVILNRVPTSVVNERDMYLVIIVALITYFISKKVENYIIFIKILDAAGLALFTVVGAEAGFNAGLGALGVVLMGTFTGVAGGAIRDMLVQEIPFVLKEEIYALFSITGSVMYWIGINYLNIDKNMVIYFIIPFIFIGRVVAIKYDLHLPRREE